MIFTEEDRAVIRDIIAKFLTTKKLQTEKMCEEKMDNQEGIVGEIKNTVESFNKKLWAIILLLVSILGYNLITALAG